MVSTCAGRWVLCAEVAPNIHQVHLLRFKLLKAKYEYWLGKARFCEDACEIRLGFGGLAGSRCKSTQCAH